jgi:hypothetical protein
MCWPLKDRKFAKALRGCRRLMTADGIERYLGRTFKTIEAQTKLVANSPYQIPPRSDRISPQRIFSQSLSWCKKSYRTFYCKAGTRLQLDYRVCAILLTAGALRSSRRVSIYARVKSAVVKFNLKKTTRLFLRKKIFCDDSQSPAEKKNDPLFSKAHL